MTIKRSSQQKRLAKWSKLGLSLAAVTVLGGLVEPGVADFVSPKVYAETYVNTSDQLIGVVIWHIAENTDGSSFRLNGDGGYMEVQPGQEIISSAPNYDGYTLSHTSYAPPAWDGGDGILRFVYKQNKIAEQPEPTEKPVETQVVTAKVTAFKLEELMDANYKYQPMGTFSLEPVVIQLQPGENYTPPSYDGYKLVKFENSNSVTDITPEEATISYADFTPGQEISLDYYYLNTKQVYDVVNKRYVDRDTNLSPLPPTEAPTIDNTTDTTNSSVDMAFQEASTRLYNLLMTASRLNPADYTTESYNKYYDSHDEFGLYGTIITVLDEYKEVVNGNIRLEDRWDNGASPKGWLTVVYNANSTVLEQALAGLVAVQQETPSDSGSAGTDEGTTAQTPADKPAETPSETPAKSPAETPTNVQTSADQVGQSATEPTVLSNQDSQAGTASPTGQSVPGKQETKQETKEQAAPASPSKQSTDKPAPASQTQAKSLPATGDAHSVLHMTGLGLLGLAGLVVKRRSRKSS
ncbi:TPA: LPXTG cell wall anchor domain-containing protein [Streptococcus suis]